MKTIKRVDAGHRCSRRSALGRLGLAAGGAVMGAAGGELRAAPAAGGPGEFVLCFNTATIRGQKVGLAKEVEIAAQAGYQAIEPWVEAIDQYAQGGGSLKDMRKKIADLGLTVESAISFPEWVVDDDGRRAKGLERARREMDLVAQLGGQRIATPPAGATNEPGLDLRKAAERYRALLEIGDQIGVVPQLEHWGFAKNLSRLSEVMFVALEAGHPKACVLADVFHLHKGGSDPGGLRLLSAQAHPVFHMNDYPAEPAREQINDSHRLYPGDGVAPIGQILKDLRAAGGRTVLSLELFTRKYWEQDAMLVAKTGFEKLRAVVRRG